MTEHPWFVVVYQMAHIEAQAMLEDGLNALGTLTVQAHQDNGAHLVTIECSGHVPPLTIHELVVSIDSDAILIDTRTGPLESAEETA